jgi:GntR family transcriptional regulator
MRPNEHIAEVIRRQIRDGELTPGHRIPSVRELAERHGVAANTVRNALSWLRIEGYITTTQRGSWVADTPTTATAPRDILARAHRTGSTAAAGETKRVLSGALVVPPMYVAELYDQDPGEQLLRREYVTGTGPTRTALCVDWYRAALAEAVPELLSTAPGQRTPDHPGAGNDILALIAERTGRRVTRGRDAMHARTADHREATRLAVAVGAPVLAVVHEWSDADGLIVYGERVMPARLTIGYEYDLTVHEQGSASPSGAVPAQA